MFAHKIWSYDSTSKLRARLAYINAKYLKKKPILLNNMKHHKFYKTRIATFLTAFELNPSSIFPKLIETKFYSLDEESHSEIDSEKMQDSLMNPTCQLSIKILQGK